MRSRVVYCFAPNRDLDNVYFLQGVGEEIGVFIITCIALEKEKKTFLREFRFLTGVNDKQIFHLLFYLPANWKKFLHASFWVLFFLNLRKKIYLSLHV